MRQLADEADRIGHDDLADLVAQIHASRRRIERRKQLVGRIGLRLRQRIEQRRLARVRIADQRHRHGAAARALTTLRAVLPAQPVETRLQHFDPLADQPAVGFELRFAGAAQADTAFLPLQVSPRANQPGRQILQLRELDLQLAFVAAGALREDIEDQARAIDHAPVQRLLQIALLGGRECVVEDDDFDVVRVAREPQFFGFAAADEHLGIRAGTTTGEGDGGTGSRAGGKKTEFFETGFEIGLAEVDADERCVDQIVGCQDKAASIGRSRRPDAGRCDRLGRSFRVRVEIHRARRHDRRNGVLVDHLGHGVTEQHDVLVEGFDVPLELDPVDEIDRNRNVLFTQCVQKRVL